MPVKNMPELILNLERLRSSPIGERLYQELVETGARLMEQVRMATRLHTDTRSFKNEDAGLHMEALKLRAYELVPGLREGWDTQNAISTAMELEEIELKHKKNKYPL